MTNLAVDELTRLQDWYAAQCNGDWEHQYGVRIGTIDNPGWSIDIDLLDTPLAEKIFTASAIERSDGDWFHCKVERAVFKGRGGPANLRELLLIFLAWAQNAVSLLAHDWLEASRSLGFEAVSPFTAVLPNGETIVADVLLPQFGAPNGMLILRDYALVEKNEEALSAAGFGYSILSDHRAPQRDWSVYAGVLADWGWYGSPDETPDWLPQSTEE